MKKRILSLLLVLCMLLPVSAFALGQDAGTDCFNYLKNYLQTNGTYQNGVYSYHGVERSTTDTGMEMVFNLILSYNPSTNALIFADEARQELEDDWGFFRSEVTVPSTLRMPYSATEQISVLDETYYCTASITPDFTTQSNDILVGEETFGTDNLFPYTVALAFRHVQDNILTPAGHKFSALGLTALYEELYPTAPCDGGASCPSKNFTDVDRTAYYHLPMDWAVVNGVTTGVTATTFCPNNSCTRGQMVTFLWRAKGSPESAPQTNPFVDVPAGWYYSKAVLWAYNHNPQITDGVDVTHFMPDRTCTRAHVVTFLWRANGCPEPNSMNNPFPDVPNGKYYTKAVLWAAEQGITTGYDDGTFRPDADCTRAHVVTFLYRSIVK